MADTALQERILRNVQIDNNGCWIWQKTKTKFGYGRMTMHRNSVRSSEMAHRVSYQTFISDIQSGLQIDHLCKITSCVNPKHLEPVTGKENKHRSALKQQWAAKKLITHCPKGHEYTDKNTLLKSNKWGNLCRNCRKCHSEREARRYRINKEMVIA